MKVSVVLALPSRQQVIGLTVAPDCTARQAVEKAKSAGLEFSPDEIDLDNAQLGVFGERVSDDAPLSEGDRVEVYRPLRQDPMELRRQRAASESGGFSQRRK